MLEVVEPGLLSTIQDVGRHEWTHLGVPTSGACDPWSLAVANLLVDADPAAPALEMTVLGPSLRVLRSTVIGLAGADLGGRVRETGVRVVPGRSHAVEGGTTLEFPGPADGYPGARAYLALPGGIDVPSMLGSASTCLVAGFGGLGGRALMAGDRIGPRGEASGADITDRFWPAGVGSPFDPPEGRLRVLPGPHLEICGTSALKALLAADWTVSPASNRVGLRLQGPRLGTRSGSRHAEILSHGVTWGAVQLPPDGSPIVLLADHQTTGGYPVLAVAITADRPRLGQLRPGGTVRFELTDQPTARGALRTQRAALARGRAALEDTRTWDELWRSSRG